LFQDIRTLGFKDFGTLAAFMKNKASGEVVDDKTMLMERIIQVWKLSCLQSIVIKQLIVYFRVACQWSTCQFPESQQSHQCVLG
jgi:hypothetical protein